MGQNKKYEENQQNDVSDDGKNQRQGRKWAFSRMGMLAAVFLAMSILWIRFEPWAHKKEPDPYEKLAQEVQQTTTALTGTELEGNMEQETKLQYTAPVDFEELAKINPDVIGWIRIPDTVVDYPIVWTGDNETYLSRDFEGQPSRAGAIYLDFESEPDFSGRHNIIYGHHMRNGSMFAEIAKYKNEEYFQEHPNIYIYTPEREICLSVIASLYTDASGIRRKTKFENEESFQSYVDQMTKDCPFRQMPDEPVETLYSLVTCSYEFEDARTILYAYEAGEKEKAEENQE